MKPLRGAMSGAPCLGKQISPGWGLSRVKGNKREQVWDRGGGQEHGAGRGALLRVRSPRWGCHKPAGLGSQRGQGADVTPVFGRCCGSDGVSLPLWVTASPAIRCGLCCSCMQQPLEAAVLVHAAPWGRLLLERGTCTLSHPTAAPVAPW